ncbi:MAG: pyrroloquinoline quinone precursor peptide PqqA [Geminicoccaceae bacterium]
MKRVRLTRIPHQQPEEPDMKWQTPRIVEIACGCEINAYFPADL